MLLYNSVFNSIILSVIQYMSHQQRTIHICYQLATIVQRHYLSHKPPLTQLKERVKLGFWSEAARRVLKWCGVKGKGAGGWCRKESSARLPLPPSPGCCVTAMAGRIYEKGEDWRHAVSPPSGHIQTWRWAAASAGSSSAVAASAAPPCWFRSATTEGNQKGHGLRKMTWTLFSCFFSFFFFKNNIPAIGFIERLWLPMESDRREKCKRGSG